MSLGYGTIELVNKIIAENWKDEPDKKVFSQRELLFILQEMEDGAKYLEASKSQYNKEYKNFQAFVKHCLYRNLANYDTMVLLDGVKGSGKSSAAIMLAREWCKLIGIKFDPKRHIAYNNADMLERIQSLSKFEPLIADESIRFALAAEWAKKENKTLKKKLAEVRTKHLFFILCFPLKVTKIEKTYMDAFVQYWVSIFNRGNASIFVPDKNPIGDPWRLKDFSNIGSYNEFTQISTIRKKLETHPNYWTMMKIPKVPKKLYDRYLQVREHNVYDDNSVFKSVTKEDVYYAAITLSMRDLMESDGTLTMNRILLHIKEKYDLNLPKNAISSTVSDAEMLIKRIRDESLQIKDIKDDAVIKNEQQEVETESEFADLLPDGELDSGERISDDDNMEH